MTPQQIIDAMQQTSNPVGKQLVRQIVAHLERLEALDQVIAEIRDSTGLYTCPVAELSGHIESVVCNLASQNVWLMSRLPESEQKQEASLREVFDEAIHAFCPGGERTGLPRATALAMTEDSTNG